MKLFLLINILFLSFFLTGATSGNINAIYTPQSKIKFLKTSIDLGKIPRGSKHDLNFEFTNKGKDPLVIQGVHTSCGCILIENLPTRGYLPGEHGTIKLSVDTSNFSGAFQKNVVLITNNKKEHHTNLTIKANITEKICAYPPLINFDTLTSSSDFYSSPKQITLTYDRDISIKNIRYRKDILELTTKNLPQKNQKNTMMLEVRLKNIDFNTASFIKEDIIIENTDLNLKELKIPVRAFIQTNISFSKNYIEFGGVEKNQVKEQSFTISSLDRTDFDLEYTGSSLNIDTLPVKDKEKLIDIDIKADSDQKNSYTVKVRIKNSTDKKSSVSGKLSFNTPLGTNRNINFYALFY